MPYLLRLILYRLIIFKPASYISCPICFGKIFLSDCFASSPMFLTMQIIHDKKTGALIRLCHLIRQLKTLYHQPPNFILQTSRYLSLCHKEPAQGTQSPLLGAFLVFRWFFMAWGSQRPRSDSTPLQAVVSDSAFSVPPQQLITNDGGIIEIGAEVQVSSGDYFRL